MPNPVTTRASTSAKSTGSTPKAASSVGKSTSQRKPAKTKKAVSSVRKAAASKATPGTASTRSKAGGDPGSAIRVLKDEHRAVADLFDQFEKLGPRATKARESIVAKVIEALSVHASIEEQVLYPTIRQVVSGGTTHVLEALEEHHVVKWTLSELNDMSSSDERYVAKMTVLMEMVRHHVREEEETLFALLRTSMSRAELEDLGDRLLSAKGLAPTEPHPRSPDTPPGNIVTDAMALPIDAVRSLGKAAVRQVRGVAQR